jgi:Leucine-rich repeat (LRR) protein
MSINNLNSTLLALILTELDDISFCRSREVCTKWKTSIDETALNFFHRNLQKTETIPQYLTKLVTEFVNQTKSPEPNKINCTFSQFVKFSCDLAKTIGVKPCLMRSVGQINRSQHYVDALFTLWKAIKHQLTHQPDIELKTAEQISKWMHKNPSACAEITSISLNDENLYLLPPEIGLLTGLTCLFLYGNHLEYLPTEITYLTALKTLSLRRNKFTSFPQEILSLPSLRVIDLCQNQIREIPSEIVSLSNLVTLELERNQLTELPSQIVNMKLTRLEVAGNPLKNLPSNMANMSFLHTLGLDGCPLESLPDDLPALKFLKLSNCGFKNLPPMKMLCLEQLDLSHNQLKNLPEAIQLPSLITLRLHCNELQTIHFIASMTNLKTLDISHNDSLDLSKGLPNMPNLKFLTVDPDQFTRCSFETTQKLVIAKRVDNG